MNLDALFQYLGPNKNPMFMFVGLTDSLFFHFGDIRLKSGDKFLGYFITLSAVLLVAVALAFYIYLALHAPNSAQAQEFDRSSEREVADHLEKSKSHRI